MSEYEEFIFEDYSFDSAKNEVELKYSLDGKINFKETICWKIEPSNYNKVILDRALFGLWIMAGVSYFKAYLPKKISIKKVGLTKIQAEFFNKTYELGLAQFFYTNQLDWRGAINFESNNEAQLDPGSINGSGCISALGGGKDSIVAAELLKELGLRPDCWSVNQTDRFHSLTDKLELNSHKVTRVIDPKLTELNGAGAYNGHVPITAINSFIGVVLAVLLGKKSVVWAIEGTSDEANTNWKDLEVNHQYSKSSEYERDMQSYISKNIASDLEFYSVLRPLTELRIAEIFCKNYINKYKGLFSSCNANFTLNNQAELKWCGKCPKCAFVFIILSPFIKKSELLDLFGGKDMFADEDMKATIDELLGISGHKPLECVGEIAETRLAIQMSRQSGQYPELAQFDFPFAEYDYKKWITNNLPESVEIKLKEIIQSL